MYFCSRIGGLAHLVERQVRNLKVAGSSPVTSTKCKVKFGKLNLNEMEQHLGTSFRGVFFHHAAKTHKEKSQPIAMD